MPGILTHRIRVTEKSLDNAPKEESEDFVRYTIAVNKPMNLKDLLEFCFEDDVVISGTVQEFYDARPNFVMEEDSLWALSLASCTDEKDGNIIVESLEVQYNDRDDSSSEGPVGDLPNDGPKGE